jgi:hypothetical protein
MSKRSLHAVSHSHSAIADAALSQMPQRSGQKPAATLSSNTTPYQVSHVPYIEIVSPSEFGPRLCGQLSDRVSRCHDSAGIAGAPCDAGCCASRDDR